MQTYKKDSTEIAIRPQDQVVEDLSAENLEVLADLAKHSWSKATETSYTSVYKRFNLWGGLLPCNTSTILKYIAEHSLKLNERTIAHHLTALGRWHDVNGYENPTKGTSVNLIMKGLRKKRKTPKRKAKPLATDDVARMLIANNEGINKLKTVRDRAILLVGYLGGFRRSELANMECDWLSFQDEGLVIRIPSSKTDQEGDGKMKGIISRSGAICGVSALKEWLTISGISKGPVFRRITRWGVMVDNAGNSDIKTALAPASINEIIKSMANRAELNSSTDFGWTISSHSLRGGMATSASKLRQPIAKTKQQGGWSSDAMVVSYSEDGQIFSDNVTGPIADSLEEAYKSLK